MKKISALLLLILSLSLVFTFTACGGNGNGTGDGAGDNGTGDTGDSGEVEKVAVELSSIVYSEDLNLTNSGLDIRGLINGYQSATGKRLTSKVDSTETTVGEIVLGSTTREITSKANRQLTRYLRLDAKIEWDSVSYIIYVRDGSVALYWDDEQALDAAFEKLIEYVTSEEPVLVNGFKECVTFRTTADREALEAAQLEQKLDEITAKYGAGVTDAVRAHLSLFDDRFYMWLADLYEPRTCICDNYDEEGYRICLFPKDENGNYLCHGGGFYYSNSGRDHVGYDIDIESTIQAVSFLSSSGMLAEYGGSTKVALPKQMRLDIACFAKSLQSADDGYFYHPQWGTSVGTSRIGRDLGWATQGLDLGDLKPFWDTPNGKKGELGPAGQKSALTNDLTESVVSAVSKVELAASVWPSHLKTLDAFNTYMRGFNLSESSYPTGNTFASQSGQINQRDKEGLESGEFVDENNDGIADNGFVKAFETYFNSMQNPENGLWQDSVHYSSVNGLMKISSVYNSLKIQLPNATKAFESAAEMAALDADTPDIKGKSATGSVDVYNPWVAMAQVISNINKYGNPTEATALKTALKERAEEMIRVTTAKTKKFAKEDGSYGYTWTSSPANSQGAPVAVPGTIEGDVNGGCIALRGVWGNMTSVLGFSVPLYYHSDFIKFMNRINELDPVIKHDGVNSTTPVDPQAPVDFEDEDVGSSVATRVNVNTDKGGIEVAKDPTNSKNQVIKLYNKPSTSTGTAMTVTTLGDNAPTCLILEWDMYVSTGAKNSTTFQIKIGESFMLTVGIKDGYAYFGDSSSTSTGVKNDYEALAKLNFKEWHNIRLEYYPDGDGDKKVPATKIYIDDTLIAVSDNYFGKEKGTPPSKSYTNARFYALQSTDVEVYLDNIVSCRAKQAYVEESIGSFGGGTTPSEPGQGTTPSEPGQGTTPASKYGNYDFEAANDGFSYSYQTDVQGISFETIADPKNAANKVLKVVTAKVTTKGTNLVFKTNENAPANANCYVYELDVEVDATHAQKNFIAQLYINKDNSTNISSVNINAEYKDNAYVITAIQARHNNGGKASGNIATNIAFNDRVNIRMEYYKDNGMCKIYINGTYAGELINYWSEANSQLNYGVARFYCTYSTEACFYFDNVKAEAIVKAYVAGDPTTTTPAN